MESYPFIVIVLLIKHLKSNLVWFWGYLPKTYACDFHDAFSWSQQQTHDWKTNREPTMEGTGEKSGLGLIFASAASMILSYCFVGQFKLNAKWLLSDSSVLHCAYLLRTIFALLARSNKRVHLHNERSFPQAKLDNEINVPFILNEHGDLYILSHNNCGHIIVVI